MSERDDLVADIEAHVDAALDPHRRAWGYVPAREEWAHMITRRLPDHLLAAGWSRPRVVTTSSVETVARVLARQGMSMTGLTEDEQAAVLDRRWRLWENRAYEIVVALGGNQ